uniref:Uncharacterized protein n=1 Tax=Arion vulgaris TaxID=1028688 RepID=A0A0B7BDB2_9EUPU
MASTIQQISLDIFIAMVCSVYDWASHFLHRLLLIYNLILAYMKDKMSLSAFVTHTHLYQM